MQKRLGTVQNFTLTNASQASDKFGAQTYRVRVSVGSTGTTPTNAYILFGDSTSLTVSSTNGSLVPSLWSEDFDVTPGQTFYTISQTTLASGAGVLSITELT